MAEDAEQPADAVAVDAAASGITHPGRALSASGQHAAVNHSLTNGNAATAAAAGAPTVSQQSPASADQQKPPASTAERLARQRSLRAQSSQSQPASPMEQEQLAARLQALDQLCRQLAPSLGNANATALQEAVIAVNTEVERANGQASGLAALLNDAIEQGERLKAENRELRRKQEDAVLDTQLKQAEKENEKLRLAGDAYKRELLQQKLSDTEWALSREQDRAKEAEAEKAALAATVKELRHQLKAAGADGSGAPSLASLQAEGAEPPMSAKEREEIACILTAGEGERRSVDAQVLIAAAKGLRSTAILEQHLQQTLSEKERLAQNVEELNDIVFSKTFKAPSAWADRERKYKMEKRDWEIEAKKLQKSMEKLRAENKRYRETNRTAEFEARAAELQCQVEAANKARVAAQQEAHELRLKMRRNDGEFISDGKRAPHESPFRSATIQPPPAPRPAAPLPEEAEELPQQTDLPPSDVIRTIKGLERHNIGVHAPKSPKFSMRTRSGRASGPPDSPVAPSAAAAAGSQEWGMAVVESLESQGIGRTAAQAPAAAAAMPDGGGSGSRRASTGGEEGGSRRRASISERSAAFSGGGSGSAPGSPLRRRSMAEGGAAPDVISSPRRSPLQQGDAPQLRQHSAVAQPAQPQPTPGAAAAVHAAGTASDPPPSSAAAPAAVAAELGSPVRLPASPGTAADAASPSLLGLPAAAAADPLLPLRTDSASTAAGMSTPVGPEAATPGMVTPEFASPARGAVGTAEAVWSGIGGDAAASVAARGSVARDSVGGTPGAEAMSAQDREAMYRMYSHHVEAEDVGALKWQAAELTSRLEMMQAQLSKAALAAERAEEDKAALEAELATALEAASKPQDTAELDAMQGRLAELVEKKANKEEELAVKAREQEERLKAAQSALQQAHRQHQAMEKRIAKMEKQLAAASTALGPAAATVLEASETGSTASGEEGTPRDKGALAPAHSAGEGDKQWGWGDGVGALSEDDLEAMRLREENQLLMDSLVRSKLEMAETQSDYVKTKRALIRAVEKQVEMSDKMDLLKAELERVGHDMPSYHAEATPPAPSPSLRSMMPRLSHGLLG